jgi:predicted PurR-regulated permease PerM
MVFKLRLCFNSFFTAAALILYNMNVFVLAILIYLLYRFIAGFLIPVIRTTSHVRQQFNQHAERSTQNAERPTQNAQSSTPDAQRSSQTSGASKVGEYIDFEEVK